MYDNGIAHVNSARVSRSVEVTEQTMQRSSQLSLGLFVRHNKNRLEVNGQAKPITNHPLTAMYKQNNDVQLNSYRNQLQSREMIKDVSNSNNLNYRCCT